jgi:hypothetical protein
LNFTKLWAIILAVGGTMDNLAEVKLIETDEPEINITKEISPDVILFAEEMARAMKRMSVDEEYRKKIAKNIS